MTYLQTVLSLYLLLIPSQRESLECIIQEEREDNLVLALRKSADMHHRSEFQGERGIF